jgi:hypothetical protein
MGSSHLAVHPKKKEYVVWGEDEESEDEAEKKEQHVRGCWFTLLFFACRQSILQF